MISLQKLLFYFFTFFTVANLFAQAPVVTGPTDQTVLEGQTATFNVSATGTEPFTYQWQVSLAGNGFDWTDITGATNASYTTPETTLGMNGIWLRCNVANDSGSVSSSYAILTVNPVPPTITTQPSDQNVIVGETATFSVIAEGSEPLSYQWEKNDVDIAGANSSSYTTPSAILLDDGSLYSCVVQNSAGSVTSNYATLSVQLAPGRISDGLQVLYDFKEGTGNVIHDVSGVGTSMDLTISNTSTVNWTADGIDVIGVNSITSGDPATKIINACQSTNELTIEAWIRPANVVQGDVTARIITLAGNKDQRNFVVAQINDTYNVATRSLDTDDRGHPGIWADDGVTTSLTHFVYTRNSAGSTKLFINGELLSSEIINGDFSTWNSSYIFGLANEIQDLSKPWMGSFFLVAIYNKALSVAEIEHNLNEGVPLLDDNVSIKMNPRYQGALVGESIEFRVGAVAKFPLNYQWQVDKGSGYANIPGATNSFYRTPAVTINDNKNDYRCVISNDLGEVTSNFARLYVTPNSLRVSASKQAEYDFKEGSGNIINDVSGIGIPLNLEIQQTNAVDWTPYGLNLTAPANIISSSEVSKIVNSSLSSLEFTFEAWIKPSTTSVDFARIASIAQNSSNRNFYLSQNDDNYELRARTNINLTGSQSIKSPSGSVDVSNLTHLVYTFNEFGIRKIFINGLEVNSDHTFGLINNWDNTYMLSLGSEVDNTYSWKGLLNYVIFYGRALSPTEVVHNYSFGPLGEIPEILRPSSLSAETETFNEVLLTWVDNSDNENGFIIEKSVGDSLSFVLLDSVGANITSYTDTNILESNIYFYRVKSYNVAVTSENSNNASVISLLKEPTELTAQALVFGEIILRWTENSEFESGIVIERGEGDPAVFSVMDTVQPNINSYFDETVGDFIDYRYRIKVYNNFTNSAYSNVVSIKSLFSSIPAPTALSIELHPIYGIPVLTWTDNSGNEKGFVIERKIAGAEYSVIDSVDADSTTFMDETVSDNTIYLYRVRGYNDNTTSDYSNIVDISVLTNVNNENLPTHFSLSQNYPNPFNPNTTIKFGLPQNSWVTLTIYNMLGQKVMTLVDESLSAGVHNIEFDASKLTSGIYIYSLATQGVNGNNFVTSKKMILMK